MILFVFLCVGFSAIFKNEIKIFKKKPFDKLDVDYIKLEDIKLVKDVIFEMNRFLSISFRHSHCLSYKNM